MESRKIKTIFPTAVFTYLFLLFLMSQNCEMAYYEKTMAQSTTIFLLAPPSMSNEIVFPISDSQIKQAEKKLDSTKQATILAALETFFGDNHFAELKGLELGVTNTSQKLFRYLQSKQVEMTGIGFEVPGGEDFIREDILVYLARERNRLGEKFNLSMRGIHYIQHQHSHTPRILSKGWRFYIVRCTFY